MTEKPPPTKRPAKAAAKRPARKAAIAKADDGSNVVPFQRQGSGRAASEGRSTRKQSNGQQTSAKAIAVAQRRAEVLGLKRNGATNVQIADYVREKFDLPTYTNKSAWDDIRESLERIRIESVHEYVDEAVDRLDYALRKLAPVLDNEDDSIKIAALNTFVRIEKRRADLLGLDANRRIELTGINGGPVLVAPFDPSNDDEVYEAALAAVNDVLGPDPT